MLRRVDRLLIRVPHLAAAVRYYRDVLGLQLVREDRRVALLRFAAQETELVLHCDPDLPAEAVYYLVDDVRGLYQRREELKLQFLQSPKPATRGWRAAVRDPFGNILFIVDRSQEGSAPASIEDAKPPGALFGGVPEGQRLDRTRLVRAYEEIGRTADDLPYTPDFEKLCIKCVARQGEPPPSRSDVWRTLLNLRKSGKLPKLGEARSRPPQVADEDRQRLRSLLGEQIGRRDRLPYTPGFDALVDEFNRGLARPLSPHLVWRLVATLAK